jgi:terminase large subunit-like protein
MASSSLTCPPRYGTPRSPDRPTLGPAVGEVARRLGLPLMPWQQHVADVILEVMPNGRLAYTEFGLTVPRQSGKSTLVLAKAVHRASATGFFGPRQRMVYTAQTRHKAREKWEEDYKATLESSVAFAAKVAFHMGNGNEHVRFPNGSRFGIESNTEKAGHGPTIDEAYLDEAFAHADARGEQAFRPAMITRKNKQLGVISTRGWKGKEPYLLPKIEAGRASVEEGLRIGRAYFEWSAPDDADPHDRDVWRACMPALGYTIDEEAIEAELLLMGLPDFRRSMLNQSVIQTEAGEWLIIGKLSWDVRKIEPVRPVGPVAFAVAASWPDADSAAVCVIGQHAGRIIVQVLDHRPGTSWAVERLKALTDAWPNVGVVLDAGGPAGRLIAPLEAAKVPLVKASMSDAARAFGTFVAEVTGDIPRLGHFDQPELSDALRVAGRRPLGDGFTWARKDAIDISPLEAATLGVWAFLSLAHLAEPERSVYEDRGLVEL